MLFNFTANRFRRNRLFNNRTNYHFKNLILFLIALILSSCGEDDPVSVAAQNLRPLAFAGEDISVKEQTEVTITGLAADRDGYISDISWSQIDIVQNTDVTIHEQHSSSITFTTPPVSSPVLLRFQITVTDNKGGTQQDDVVITVKPAHLAPVAIAKAEGFIGNHITVYEQTDITLDGSLSSDSEDGKNDDLKYQWTQSSGDPYIVSLANASTVKPVFKSPALNTEANLNFFLKVTDSKGETSLDTDGSVITVTVKPNILPVSSDSYFVTSTDSAVIRNKLSANDEDGHSLEYEIVDSPQLGSISLDEITAVFSYTPTGTAGIDTFTFRAKDYLGYSQVSTVTIEVKSINPDNILPLALVGEDITVFEQTEVILDGSGSSDADGDVVQYHWIQTDDSVVPLINAFSDELTFMSPDVAIETDLAFTLKVTDNEGASSLETAASNIIVTVKQNTPPDTSDFQIESPIDVDVIEEKLSANDADGHLVTYEIVDSPQAGSITSFDSLTGEFSYLPPSATSGTYKFTYRAKDYLDYSEISTVTIKVGSGNLPPVAIAGAEGFTGNDITVLEQTEITLDGSGSSDDAIAYSWEQIKLLDSDPDISLIGASSVSPGFTSPHVTSDTTLIFYLEVTDTEGDISSSEAQASYIRVLVKPNTLPVANDLNVDTFINTDEIQGQLTATDPDIENYGQSMTYELNASNLLYGNISYFNPATGEFIYKPSGTAGVDHFTFVANDGLAKSTLHGNVTIDISSTISVASDSPVTKALESEDVHQLFSFTANTTGVAVFKVDVPESCASDCFIVTIDGSDYHTGNDLVISQEAIEGQVFDVQITSGANFDSNEYSLTIENYVPISATLTWVRPEKNEDESDLTDLDHYHIYYGDGTGEFDQKIIVDAKDGDEYVEQYKFELLRPDTSYEFRMTAINSLGIESDYSGEVHFPPD